MARDTKAQYLTKISDEQLTCMVQKHLWPVLELSGPVPKGFRAPKNNDGSYQMIWTCLRCDSERVKTTLPKGVYDANALYDYDYAETWVHIPDTWELTHADLVAEWYKRRGSALFKG